MSSGAVHTTAKIVLGELEGLSLPREPDSAYGYRELAPQRR